MSDIPVNYHGIHWSPAGVAFLHQEKSGANALGLRDKSPFRIVLQKRNKRCNHIIPLATPLPDESHWAYFARLVKDPLVQAMLPIPKSGSGTFYVDDPDDKLRLHLLVLSRMSSPVAPVVHPIWTLRGNVIMDELQATNVQPFVLTQVKTEHNQLVNQIAKAAAYYPRTLIMTGAPDLVLPPTVHRLQTELLKYPIEDLISLAWEAIGAVVVRKFMRKEWTADPEALMNPKVAYKPLPRG